MIPIPSRRLRPAALWVALAGLLAFPAASLADPVLPAGGRVAAGEAAIATDGGRMTIEQGSDKAILDWRSFSIGEGNAVRFAQPGTASVALNRVDAAGGESRILGTLAANGKVWLVNPNGVFFGPAATVDVAGLVATSAGIGDEDFLAGRYDFSVPGRGDAAVENQGTIRVADYGLAALVAPSVRNSGLIRARLGKVALASAETFRLGLYGDGLVGFAVASAAKTEAVLSAGGRIEADGGHVLLTAAQAESVVDAAINLEGVVVANTVKQVDGTIVLGHVDLDAGDRGVVKLTGEVQARGQDGAGGTPGGEVAISGGFVSLGGRIAADGAEGGKVEVTAGGTLSVAAEVTATGFVGAGGTAVYEAGGRYLEPTGSRTDVSGANGGGTIAILAGESLNTSGAFVAQGGAGQGGRIDLSAGTVRLLSARLDASGARGGLSSG